MRTDFLDFPRRDSELEHPMSRVWRDDIDPELRPVRLMLLIPALFIIGCIMEVMIG